MELVPRSIAGWAAELLTETPVLVIEGARQVGKSTLAQMLSSDDAEYVSLDDEVVRAFAKDDPVGFVKSARERRLVIDEVQRCPEIVLPLKAEVDRDRRAGRFVLTGSANLLRVPGAQDSLAGRAMTIRLLPFSQGELVGRAEDWVAAVLRGATTGDEVQRADLIRRITIGGYPPVQRMSRRVRTAWLTDYANRLVERDSADLATAQVPVLRRLLHLIAAAPGQELVLERLAQELGVASRTVSRYVEILESLFLLQILPSWSRNLTKRQIQRPKAFLSDTGLASALTGLTSEHLASPHGADHLGPLLENFVVAELSKQAGWSSHDFTLSHFRDRNGAEVDVIIETARGVIAVEVKAAGSATRSHFKHLITLREGLGGEFLAGIVLNLGAPQQAGDRLWALPVTSLWRAASV